MPIFIDGGTPPYAERAATASSTIVPTCPRASLCAGKSFSNATTSKSEGSVCFAPFFAFITAPSRPGGLAGARGFQQNIAQPGGIARLKMKGLAEYPSLVSASRGAKD